MKKSPKECDDQKMNLYLTGQVMLQPYALPYPENARSIITWQLTPEGAFILKEEYKKTFS